MLPEGVHAVIRKDSYDVPAIFKLLAKTGNIEEKMMYNTYNMGIGMVLGVAPEDAQKTIALLEAAGEKAFIIGETTADEKGVTLC
jgi:phosphoribosylformylglycinamidine cyclo-ligase